MQEYRVPGAGLQGAGLQGTGLQGTGLQGAGGYVVLREVEAGTGSWSLTSTVSRD